MSLNPFAEPFEPDHTTVIDRLGDRVVVRKEGQSPAARHRLSREAAVLARCQRPGVVELVEHHDDGQTSTLVTGWVGTHTLATATVRSVEQVAGLIAVLADTVEALHLLGVIHGRITPDHVVLDGQGYPVLIGFADASLDGDPAKRHERPDDAAGLGQLLLGLLGSLPPEGIAERARRAHRRRLSALTTLAQDATGPDRWARPSAHRIAAAILAAVPDARPAEGADLTAQDPGPIPGPTGVRLGPPAGPAPAPAIPSPAPPGTTAPAAPAPVAPAPVGASAPPTLTYTAPPTESLADGPGSAPTVAGAGLSHAPAVTEPGEIDDPYASGWQAAPAPAPTVADGRPGPAGPSGPPPLDRTMITSGPPAAPVAPPAPPTPAPTRTGPMISGLPGTPPAAAPVPSPPAPSRPAPTTPLPPSMWRPPATGGSGPVGPPGAPSPIPGPPTKPIPAPAPEPPPDPVEVRPVPPVTHTVQLERPTLPRPGRPVTPPDADPGGRGRRIGLIAGAVLLLIAVAAVGTTYGLTCPADPPVTLAIETTLPVTTAPAPTTPTTAAPTTAPGPTAPVRFTTVDTTGTVTHEGRRYRLARPGPDRSPIGEVSVGDFRCNQTEIAVALDPGTGTLWVFDEWSAAGSPLDNNNPIRVKPGSHLVPSPIDARGCAPLIVREPDGHQYTQVLPAAAEPAVARPSTTSTRAAQGVPS